MAWKKQGKATPRKQRTGQAATQASAAPALNMVVVSNRFGGASLGEQPLVTAQHAHPQQLQPVQMQAPVQPARKLARLPDAASERTLALNAKAAPKKRASADRVALLQPRAAAQATAKPSRQPPPAALPPQQQEQQPLPRPQLLEDNPALIVKFDDSSGDEEAGSGYDSQGRSGALRRQLPPQPPRSGRLSIPTPPWTAAASQPAAVMRPALSAAVPRAESGRVLLSDKAVAAAARYVNSPPGLSISPPGSAALGKYLQLMYSNMNT